MFIDCIVMQNYPIFPNVKQHTSIRRETITKKLDNRQKVICDGAGVNGRFFLNSAVFSGKRQSFSAVHTCTIVVISLLVLSSKHIKYFSNTFWQTSE